MSTSSAESSTERTPSRVYKCSLCPRSFASSYALGGHQNAHRRERSEELAGYIRHHFGVASGDQSRKAVFETGEPSHNKKAKVNDETEELSLELTLAVRGVSNGTAKENNNANITPQKFNYPDVLFPASEFTDTSLDLELKL